MNTDRETTSASHRPRSRFLSVFICVHPCSISLTIDQQPPTSGTVRPKIFPIRHRNNLVSGDRRGIDGRSALRTNFPVFGRGRSVGADRAVFALVVRPSSCGSPNRSIMATDLTPRPQVPSSSPMIASFVRMSPVSTNHLRIQVAVSAT